MTDYKKESRGRKPLPRGTKRDDMLRARVSHAEKLRAVRQAEAAGYQLSDLMRRIIVEGDLTAIDALIRVTQG